ncbi:hypothetical protein A2707_03695 [Candidatus Saccharibacteria bacterium RIFCSPHIGHO2_01_FULL_45_15]|nr:MAG: hypothetical protein A2707_03695 [Candidatus Saccharibacteria bacterium RIFCSPHIGHO2_01_FULL_45_15]OGL28683.1 MAG: hypothetical protein A3C39_05515 [Candidatus Saccharibacteria bacterium RIFCSPHIGHO2_02_FULL_46_12]OGL31486.1 MAG: hypothetical protein A3E76_03700 [Candidatus Saccharibacteria bacterium RIFCSPHIGHO2_12_FULL_44_22]
MVKNNLPRIGVIGAGRLGTALAKQSLSVGYEVRISNSRGPESLELLLSVLLPGAIAATIDETISKSDIVILAFPLRYYKSLTPQLFIGKIVIDAMNYWAPVEGDIAEFADATITSSEMVQQYLHDAHVIKTLNHIAYNEIEEHALPLQSKGYRAIGIAGDDRDAKLTAMAYVEALGFDGVDLGVLKNGALLQPDTRLFNARMSADSMKSQTAVRI